MPETTGPCGAATCANGCAKWHHEGRECTAAITATQHQSTRPRVWNKRANPPLNAVYVGRPTRWGNPFVVGKDGDRAGVIRRYRAWVCDQPELVSALPTLRGCDLVCWCAPAACHADVLVEMANG